MIISYHSLIAFLNEENNKTLKSSGTLKDYAQSIKDINTELLFKSSDQT